MGEEGPPGGPSKRRAKPFRLPSLLRRAKVIHEKPRPVGVTAVARAALAAGGAALAPTLLGVRGTSGAGTGVPELALAAGALFVAAGAGLLRRWKWALYLAGGLAAAGAAWSGAGLVLGRPLPPLEGSSAWGWLLGLWYSLLVLLYLRQKRVVEAF